MRKTTIKQEIPDLLTPKQREAVFGSAPADPNTAKQHRVTFVEAPKVIGRQRLSSSELEAELRRAKWETGFTLAFKAVEVAGKIALHLFLLIISAAMIAPLLHRDRHH